MPSTPPEIGQSAREARTGLAVAIGPLIGGVLTSW
jgi:hypothetical protein